MADRDKGTIQVIGARQLRKTLKAAGEDLTDLKKAHKEAAYIAARASAALTPVGRTGQLRRSVRSSGTTTAGIIRAGKKSVPYANAVHWGRKWWPNKQNARHLAPFMGRPFLSDGAQNSEGQWLPIYERTVEGAIERVEGM